MTEPRRISEAELHAYVDGELSPGERAEVASWLRENPDQAAEVAALEALNRILCVRFAGLAKEELPHRHRAVLDRVVEVPPGAGAARGGWTRPMLVAAAFLLVAALSAIAGLLAARVIDGRSRVVVAEVVQPAVGAHLIYTREVRHPVEVRASEEEHLVRWLTKRIGGQIKAPRLSDEGFNLVGGRLLPDGGRPAAQLMYETTGGRRLTLYVRKEYGQADTAFRVADDRGVRVFYWVDQQLAYALVSDMPREQLLRLARVVYDQLNK